MDVIPPFIANPQTSVAIEPGECALYHPTVSAQPFLGLDTPSGNPALDAPLARCSAALGEVVCFVGVQLVRPLARSTAGALDRLNSIDHLLEHHRVVLVGPRELRCQWDALPVDHNMPLRARFASIRRIRAGFFAPPGAGILAASSEARDQSILSASPKRSSSARCSLCHTPALCKSRSLRQQVIPLPQPISLGNISQGMPLRNTKRMPASALRSGIRGRPPLGLSGSDGRSGLITFHSSSVRIGFAIP